MKIDYETIKQKYFWKQDEDLVVPHYLQRMTQLDFIAKIRLPYKNIFGSSYSIEKLQQDLSNISIEDCLYTISIMLTEIENNGVNDKNISKLLIGDFIAKPWRQKVWKLLNSDERFVFIDEQQLLVFLKYCILYAKDSPADGFNNTKSLEYFSRALLGIESLFFAANLSKEDISEEELLVDNLRSQYFHTNDHFGLSLLRTEKVFIQIPNSSIYIDPQHHQWIDFQKLFKDSVGMNLRDYLYLNYAIISHFNYVKHNQEKANPISWFIRPYIYFRDRPISKEQIDKLLGQISKTTEELKSILKKQNPSQTVDFSFNFNGIKQYPLVSYRTDKYFPMGLRFLKEKAGADIYWIIFDWIKYSLKDEDLLSRYTNFYGSVFESYVNEILSKFYPSENLLFKRIYRNRELQIAKNNNAQIVDFIIVGTHTLTVIESKSSRLQIYKTLVKGDLMAFNSDIDKIISEGLEQIQSTIDLLNQKLLEPLSSDIGNLNIRKYIPVILIPSHFPLTEIVWKYISERLKKNYKLSDQIINDCQILSIYDLEMLEALIENGYAFETILENKISDKVFCHLPMSSYLYYEFFSKKNYSSKYLNMQHKRFAEQAIKFTLDLDVDLPKL